MAENEIRDGRAQEQKRREDRLAKALRDNLARRKGKARATREEPSNEDDG